MIVAISTSSAWASVALFDEGGLVGARSLEAPRAASAACLTMLKELLDASGKRVNDVEEWIADIGPGSFIGVRVGVVLAKTMAFANGRPTRGMNAFDLISPDEVVAIPCRKGEWFVRVPGQTPTRTTEYPALAVGFGADDETPRFPDAGHALGLRDRYPRMDADSLMPDPLMQPSISQPKHPYRRVGG